MSDVQVTTTCEIPLSHGLFAIVDATDYEWLSQWKWSAHETRNGFYARRGLLMEGGGRRTGIFMHRLIMEPSEGMQIDHRNGNTLDNRRENLRVCTNAENARNRGSHRDATSRFCGVCWDKNRQKWMAKIMANGKHVHIGRFPTEELAAHAYDEAAIRLHGDFARLNFPLI